MGERLVRVESFDELRTGMRVVVRPCDWCGSDDVGVVGGFDPENLPSELGVALGREVARLVDVEERLLRGEFGRTPPRCHDCAARLGSVPNQCEVTLGNFLKCATEGEPFYCHQGMDQDERGLYVGDPKVLCRGWVALMGMDRMTALMSRVVTCAGCGQKNRVLLGKDGATCGRCRSAITWSAT